MDIARRTAAAVVSAGVILSLVASCGTPASAPQEASSAVYHAATARNAVNVEAVKDARPAKTTAPSIKRLAVVGFVVADGYLSQSIGQETTSTRTVRGRYTLVVKGLNPQCEDNKPVVAVTLQGLEGKLPSRVVSTDCDTGDVTVKVVRKNFAGKRLNGAFYFAIYRGAGPKPDGVANPKSNRVASGHVGAKGKVSKIHSDHRVTARRYGTGEYDVIVRRLDKGCSNNAPLVLVHVEDGGVSLAMGAGVDCQTGHTSLPFNIYTGRGAKKNSAFTFRAFQGQSIAQTTRPVARCQLAVDAKASC